MKRKLETKFTFAGFSFPRYIVRLKRENKVGRRVDTTYYIESTPIVDGAHKDHFFYLGDMGSPNRYKFCDDIATRTIKHHGWFIDEYQSDTIRGLVVLLSHGRYLAGWTMGKGMSSAVCCDTMYDDELTAALDADTIARRTAELEREYRENDNEEN